MKDFLCLLCCMMFIGCNNEQPTMAGQKNDSAASKTTAGTAAEKSPSVTLISLYKKDSSLLKDIVKGKIITGDSWQDAAGTNMVILTESENIIKKDGTQNKQLYAYCFLKDGEAWKQQWLVQDRIDACEVDATCEFYQSSLSITDVDKDTIAEVSFIYKLSCKGDVSPDDKKLIMYEGTNKYAIRGSTTLQKGESKEGGTKIVDAAFKKAPTALLNYAEAQWSKFGIEKY